ncbi:MAG: Glyoxalase/Bleomycin resistance protein/Dioxygenase superfamily [Chloroflexota bacterium]|jgi:predicted enzyme related to lactoylglutathione lyase|nr:Glyoxalase/Bleomycin resistance protein/Dioxygenase superfamily [Chloroflexota bacterium]
MFKVTRLQSWNASTEALPETMQFYQTLFGAAAVQGEPTTQRRSDGTEVTIGHLRLGELRVGLYQWPDGRRPAWDHHTFEVAWAGEPDVVRAEVERLGLEIESFRHHGEDAGYNMVLRDPEGNRVELSIAPEA